MPRSGGFLVDDNKKTDDRQTDCFTTCILSYLSISQACCNGLPLSQVCMCLIWGTAYCSGGPFMAHTGCLGGPFMMTQVVLGDQLPHYRTMPTAAFAGKGRQIHAYSPL